MIFFSADLHFGHQNIIKYCDRPFVDKHEMDKVLLNNINNLVKEQDEFWILGDFCWFDKNNPEEHIKKYRNQIKCKNVRLILGNHDPHDQNKYWEPHKILLNYFSSVHTMTNARFNNRQITLCHYAMRTWNQSHRDAIQLYGHTHYNLPDDDSLSMDVGVDAVAGRKTGLTKREIAFACQNGDNPLNPLDYKPLSINEIFNFMDNKEQKRLFNDLADRWEYKIKFMSNPNLSTELTEFTDLVSFREKAISWIKERLKKNFFWTIVLHEILQEAPNIPNTELGRIESIKSIWLDFLTEKGY